MEEPPGHDPGTPRDDAPDGTTGPARPPGGEAPRGTPDVRKGGDAIDGAQDMHQGGDAGDGTPHGPPGDVVLIGTGHVLRIQDAVRGAIEAIRPDVVCVELDPGRLQALMDRRAGRPRPRGGNWWQRRLQAFQESVAEAYGAEAGGEMLAAVEGGQTVGARVVLVDRDVQVTLRRALKQLRLRERLRVVWLMAGGGVKSLLPRRRSTRDVVDEELRQYAADPDKALQELGRQFPTLRRVVIDERDQHMAQRIRRLSRDGRSVVAVVGDGHIPGMQRLLGDLPLRVFRLDDAREGRLPKPEPGGTHTVSFGFRLGPPE